MNSKNSFTLIELLVVIAILAILSVVIVIVINPADLIRQSRDTNRLTDLNQLNKALSLFDVTNPNDFTGTSSIVYVSLPDTTTTCANLSLPTLPSGYTYNCVTTSTLIKTDGTGWIPVNFDGISYGSPIQKLPIDPANTTSSAQYYSYIPGGSWELNGSFESEKFRADPKKAKTNLPGVIAVGTDLSLNPSYREPAAGQNQILGSEIAPAGFTSWTTAGSPTNITLTGWDATATNDRLLRSSLTVGTRYSLTFIGTISNVVGSAGAGFYFVADGSGASSGMYSYPYVPANAMGNGTYSWTKTFTAVIGTQIRFQFTGTSGSVTNATVSIKEITQESGSLVFDVMNSAGTIQDITGNKTATNTAVSAPNISHNNVMEFNGSTSKLDLGADFIGTGDYSVAGWIYARSFGEISRGRIIDNGKFVFGIGEAGVTGLISWSDGSTIVNSGAGTILVGRWYHVSVTRTTNGTTNFYINGILSGTVNQNGGTPVAGTTNVIIGNRNGTDRTFDGYIYRLKGYDRILNTTEIQQLFNNQRFLFGI